MRYVKIPQGWNGADALVVIGFLEDVIRAVWREHGRKIADELSANIDEASFEPRSALEHASSDEDLPF